MMIDNPGGYFFSVLTVGGGLAGYITAGSTMSVVMGLVFGLLLATLIHGVMAGYSLAIFIRFLLDPTTTTTKKSA